MHKPWPRFAQDPANPKYPEFLWFCDSHSLPRIRQIRIIRNSYGFVIAIVCTGSGKSGISGIHMVFALSWYAVTPANPEYPEFLGFFHCHGVQRIQNIRNIRPVCNIRACGVDLGLCVPIVTPPTSRIVCASLCHPWMLPTCHVLIVNTTPQFTTHSLQNTVFRWTPHLGLYPQF